MANELSLDELLDQIYGSSSDITDEELAQYLPEPYTPPPLPEFQQQGGMPQYAPQGGGQGAPQGAAYAAPYVQAAAEKWGVPADLLMAQMQQESQFKANANSGKAFGWSQFTGPTWDRYARGKDRRDIAAASDAQAHYMHDLYNMFGDWDLALAGYNAGEHNVQKYGNQVPPFKETREYIQKVHGYRGQYADLGALLAAPQEPQPQQAPQAEQPQQLQQPRGTGPFDLPSNVQIGRHKGDVFGLEQLDPAVLEAVRQGAQFWDGKVIITDAGRHAGKGEKGNHSKGNAVDILLVDKNGRELPNIRGGGKTARAYEQFWQNGVAMASELYPDLPQRARWGGNFYSSTPADYMHLDVTPNRPTAGGSLITGATPQMLKQWGGESQPMVGGNPAAHREWLRQQYGLPPSQQSQPQAPQQPQSNTEIVRLSDGTTVEIEKGMGLDEVAQILRQNNVAAEPLRIVPLPNGETVEAPYNYTDDQVFDIVRKEAPEVFGRVPRTEDDKHGVVPAAISSFESGVGSTLGGIGGAAGWVGQKFDLPIAREAGQYLTKKGEEWQKMGQEAYQELTPEEAKAQGAMGQFKKYIAEPVAGFVGSATAAVPLMALPGGAATRIAGFTAQELGGQLERQKAAGQTPDVEKAAPWALASGAIQNSLLGPLKYVSQAFGKPEVVATLKNITQTQGAEAAKQYAGGLLKNVLKEVGGNTAEVVGSEVLSNVAERAASGLDLMSPEALAEYENTAIKSAPGGLLGIPSGMGVHAAKQGAIEEAQLAQKQQALEAERAAAAEGVEVEQTELAKKQTEAEAELERRAGIGVVEPEEGVTPPVIEPTPPVIEPTPPVSEIPAVDITAVEEPKVVPPKEPKATPTAEEIQPTEPPKHWAEEMLGLPPKAGLVKKLKAQNLDINNPTDHEAITDIISKTTAKIEPQNYQQLEAYMDQVAPKALIETPPPEVIYAEREPSPAKIDAGSIAQPEIREEGRGATEGGEGVRISRPEIGKVEEIKAPEIAEVPPLETPKIKTTKIPEVKAEVPTVSEVGQITTPAQSKEQEALSLIQTKLEQFGLAIPKVRTRIAELTKLPKTEANRTELQKQEALMRTLNKGFKDYKDAEKSVLDKIAEIEGAEERRLGLVPEPEERLYAKEAKEEIAPPDMPRLRKEKFDAIYNEHVRSDELVTGGFGYMKPDDFLKATTSAAEEASIKQELEKYGSPDFNQRTPIELTIDKEGNIVDHEGRHRMMVLRDKGVKNVPVLIKRRSSSDIPLQKRLIAQKTGGNQGRADAMVYGLKPIHYDNKAELEAAYVEKPKEKAKGPIAENAYTPETLQEQIKQTYGKNAPRVEVSTREAENVDANTKGFFEPSTGRAVLIADNISKGEDIHGLLRHEVAVHTKKLGKSDKEFQDILKQVDTLREQGAEDVVEAFNRVPEDTKAENRTHEALAYLVQSKPKLPIVKRFMSWLRRTASKVTGDAGWLKGDDFVVMADEVLKKAAKEAPVKPARGERLLAKAPLVKETEPEERGVLRDGMKAATDAVKGGLWTRLETSMVDKNAALRENIKDKSSFDTNGKLRADLIGSANDQIYNVITTGTTEKDGGIPVFSTDGTIMIQKDQKRNLGGILKRIDKLKIKNPRVFVGEIARALRGEEILKEDAEMIEKIDNLRAKAKKLAAYAKTQSFKEGKKASDLADKYIAESNKLQARLGEEGREKLVTAEDIAEAKRRLAEHPEVQPILDDIHGVLKSLVDLWEQSGLVSKDVAKEWRSKPSYIPLYVSQEDLLNDPSKAVKMMGGGAKSLPNVKKLKGGTQAINLLENLQRHYAFMTTAAAQNQGRKSAAYDMELMGLARRTSPDDKQAIMFKDNGQEIYYHIDDPVAFNAFQAAAPLTNTLLKAARAYTKTFRAATLVNPLYWYRQLIRDPLHANVVSKTGMVTPIGATISFAKIIAGASKEYGELKRRGVVGAVDSLSDPTRFKSIAGKNPGLFKKGADWVMHVHEAADAATRVEVYKAAMKEAKKKGMSPDAAKNYATMRAREIINFANQGRSETLQAIRATVPFFSAALNSLDSVARAATGKGLNRREAAEARRLFVGRAMMIASFTTAYALAMQDDDDYINSPDAMNNWLVPTGNKDAPFIMIPLPFELGFITKVIPELIVRLNSGTLRPSEAKKMAKEAAFSTLTPPLPFPQVIKPAVEAAINFDLHTGRPIVGAGQARLEATEQTRGASALSIELGQQLGLSPAQIEHFGRGYLTELWTAIGVLSDQYLEAGQAKPEKYIGEVPTLLGGAKGVLTKPERDRDMDTFYELHNAAGTLHDTVIRAQGRGNVDAMKRLMGDKENEKKFYAAPAGRDIADQMSKVDKAIEQIQNDKSLSKEQKQNMIRDRQRWLNELASRGVARFRSLGIEEP